MASCTRRVVHLWQSQINAIYARIDNTIYARIESEINRGEEGPGLDKNFQLVLQEMAQIRIN